MLRRFLLCAALGMSAAGEGFAQARPGTSVITIDVPSSADSARVEAQYVLTSIRSPLDLRVLTRPCVTIENVRVERDGATLGVIQTQDGPWIIYRDAIPPGDTIRLFVGYDVKHGGEGVIPLLHPTAPLASVDVTVRFDDGAKRAIFPRMTRQAPGEWAAHYVAVPSFVQVAATRSVACDPTAADSGDNGGLVWRFGLLVGIMIAWVPLYLGWARRTAETERA